MRTYAQLTTSFVVFCNRVGVDESISFWGGSEVIAPTGAAILSAPLYDEGLFTGRHRHGRHPARARSRCRCCATSGPSSRSASWRGSSPSVPDSPTTRPATRTPSRVSTSRRRDRTPHPIGFRRPSGWVRRMTAPRRRSSCRPSSRSIPTSRGGSSPSSSAASSARRDSSEPSSGCRAASIRRWSRSSPRRRSAPTSCSAC